MDRASANSARFSRLDQRGHYESWFLRANDSQRERAFWIRYTVFAKRGQDPSTSAEGELWAMFFEGADQVAVYQAHPIETCALSTSALHLNIDSATLDSTRASGSAGSDGHRIEWDLELDSDRSAPLLLLSERLYKGGFPKAKALVPAPATHFRGWLSVDGERVEIDGWRGSQNHNWGSQHTDRYAWGQVAGFDDAPEAFLEVSTAQVRIGPVLSPPLTPIVLRLGEQEHRLAGIRQALRNRGHYDTSSWSWVFEGRRRGLRIRGKITGQRDRFVGLPYRNPPGGTKICLNSKLAACELELETPTATRRLTSAHGAAFEILTDRAPPGISVPDFAPNI